MRRNVLTTINVSLSFEFDDAHERNDDVIDICARDEITSIINERLHNMCNVIADEITFGDWELQNDIEIQLHIRNQYENVRTCNANSKTIGG